MVIFRSPWIFYQHFSISEYLFVHNSIYIGPTIMRFFIGIKIPLNFIAVTLLTLSGGY